MIKIDQTEEFVKLQKALQSIPVITQQISETLTNLVLEGEKLDRGIRITINSHLKTLQPSVKHIQACFDNAIRLFEAAYQNDMRKVIDNVSPSMVKKEVRESKCK